MPAIYQMSASFYTRIPSLKNKFLLPLVGFIVPEKEINTHTQIFATYILHLFIGYVCACIYVAVCVCASVCVCELT